MKKRILSIFLAALMTLSTVLTLVPVTASERNADVPEKTALSVDDLYVKNATFMWDAFDMKETDTAITVFENKMGDTDITLPVAVTMGNGYVLYPQTTSSFSLASLIPQHQVGSRYLPDDYTLEMTVHQYWDESFEAGSNLKWAIAGFGTGSSWGGQFQIWTQTPTETEGFIQKISTLNAVMNEDGTLTDHYNNKVEWTTVFVHTLNTPYSIGWVHDATYDATATYYPSTDVPMRDGALNASLTRRHYLRNAHYDNLKDKGFEIGAHLPLAYYSIRIYPFALNADQVAQNHFAELADYFAIGSETLSVIAALNENETLGLYTYFTGKTFASYADTDAFEQAILGAIEAGKKAERMKLYDTFYVKDATFLWDAYSYSAQDGAIAAFGNKLGEGSLAMTGTAYDKYVRSTSALLLTDLMTTYTSSDGNGYTLNDDFTFEIVAKQIYDEEFAAVYSPGQKYTAQTGYLLRRWADSRFEITTKTPTQNEDGTYADGLLNTLPITKVSPTGSKSSWSPLGWLDNAIGRIYTFGASFVFDATNENPQFHVQLLRDTEVFAETDYQYVLSASKQKLGITDKENALCLGYYAIRAYDFALNADELAQNHFVDLIKYYEISEASVELLTALTDADRTRLYRSFSSVMPEETSKNELEAAIAAIGSGVTSDYLTLSEIFLFDGYSSRLYVDPAIRASFTVDTAKMDVDGIKIIEMGTLSAMAGERKLHNVTVEKKDGAYAPTDADVAHNVIYQNEAFTAAIGEGGKLKVAQIVSFDAETATKDVYHTDYLFRGYAIAIANGEEFVLYTDMTSERFGDEISMYELASDRGVAKHDLNKDVVNFCIKNPEKKTFRVLTIGNSWSLNSTQYLHNIAKNLGYEDIVIGVLYTGGCSVQKHANFALSGEKGYDYYLKYDNSANGVKETKASFDDAFYDEPWDYILMQQSSRANVTSVSDYMSGLDTLVSFVKENKTNENAKLYWHATWSFGIGHNHDKKDDPDYAYVNDQDLHDHLLSEMVQNHVMTTGYFDGMIPSGKAIRNARAHFGTGLELYTTPDGYHLNSKGCAIAGLTWFAAITGEDISDFSYNPGGAFTEEELQIAITAVKDALADPYYTMDTTK